MDFLGLFYKQSWLLWLGLYIVLATKYPIFYENV